MPRLQLPLAVGALLVLQLIIVYTPFMNAPFGTEPIGLLDWTQCLAVGSGVFVVVEIETALTRRGIHPFATEVAAAP